MRERCERLGQPRPGGSPGRAVDGAGEGSFAESGGRVPSKGIKSPTVMASLAGARVQGAKATGTGAAIFPAA